MNHGRRYGFSVMCISVFLAITAATTAGDGKSNGGPSKKNMPTPADPLLTDLKTTIDMDWQRIFTTESPSLKMHLVFHGEAAKQACMVGDLKLDSFLGDDGKSYRWQYKIFGLDMSRVARGQGGEDDKTVSVDFTVPNRPTFKKISELRGSVAMLTGGELQQVTIPNAFAALDRPAESPALKALDIKLTMSRPKDQGFAGIFGKSKEYVVVQAEVGKNPIAQCEILDAKGKILPPSGHGDSQSGSFCGFDFNFSELLPPGAQVRLTIRKNIRKIRVPFALKDIAAPKIPKSWDTPVSPDDAFVDAETLPANAPPLAGIKIEGVAEWRQWSGNSRPPDLQVHLRLQGKPVEQITSFGEVDLSTALDHDGRPLDFPNDKMNMARRLLDNPSELENRMASFPKECLMHMSEESLQHLKGRAKNDKLDVDFELTEAKYFPKIQELRGSLSVELGGRFETVIVRDFLKHAKNGKPIDDKTLKSLGITAILDNREKKSEKKQNGGGVEELNLKVEHKRNAVVFCDVTDAQGRLIPHGSSSTSSDNNSFGSLYFWRSFNEPLPDDAQLRLTVHRDSRKTRIPFTLKDIVVPPMPKPLPKESSHVDENGVNWHSLPPQSASIPAPSIAQPVENSENKAVDQATINPTTLGHRHHCRLFGRLMHHN